VVSSGEVESEMSRLVEKIMRIKEDKGMIMGNRVLDPNKVYLEARALRCMLPPSRSQ
jgi:hypothetical protein